MGLLGVLALLALLLLALGPRWARARVGVEGLKDGFPDQEGEGQAWAELLAPLPLLYRLEALPQAALGLEARGTGGLAWGRVRVDLPLAYRYRRRGEHGVRLRLRLRSPLGLGERVLDLEAGSVLVYPALRGLPPLRPAPAYFLEGAPRPFGLPDPLEARGLRPYRPGDPLRLLAPKASLRLGEPLVREVERTLLGSLFLHIDAQSLHPAYLDHAASLAAWLLLLAERRGERFGLSLGEVLPLGRGLAHLRRALTLLARLAPSSTPLLPAPAPPGSTYLLISQAAEGAFLEAALKAAAPARKGVLLLLPEGYFLFPGEKGRPTWGTPPGLQRALALRGLLRAHGVELRVVRGHEGLAL